MSIILTKTVDTTKVELRRGQNRLDRKKEKKN